MAGSRNLKVVQGHPMLTAAAIDAVRQWQYFLNGQPVEVDTTITVNFAIG
jgi:protein TonB